MGKLSCFRAIVGRKKKDKGKESLKRLTYDKDDQTLNVRIEHSANSAEYDDGEMTSFSVPVSFLLPGSSRCKVQVRNHESPIETEVAYDGEDEHENKNDFSDCNINNPNDDADPSLLNEVLNIRNSLDTEMNYQGTKKDKEASREIIQSGHLSDPGIGKAEFWGSPQLKRSCSNLETRDMLKKIADHLPPLKSQTPGSPSSVLTHVSADKVMLKKHSSSQILPSRSRRLWWKLFLWSHRNRHHKPSYTRQEPLLLHPPLNQQGGYSSDTLEPNRFMELGKLGSPGSFTGESMNKVNSNDNRSWDGFQCGSGLWPQNQWVAFPTESSSSYLTRVDEWVKDVSSQPSLLTDNDEHAVDEEVIFPPSPDSVKSPAITTTQFSPRSSMNLPEEVVHANNVIQSLNSSSTVAHISGMGLKVIPAMSHFSSLRSLNFSGNYIVHITPSFLPKGLHTLNLSRNKISTIDGLRELTRLRVLDLSYNRISRIGQGLSNCTSIKELYLAGNKISYVEGLHRLLKLTILELSFNKITTAKALGQLVANYKSLLALNLLGNPIQSNVSEDQLRKAVIGLLPNLAFLNKQPINPQKAREVATEAIARAAVGSSGWSARRKTVKRSGQGGLSSSSRGSSHASGVPKSKHRLRTRSTHHHSGSKSKSSVRV